MIKEVAQTLHNDSYVQAIVTIIALLSAAYYVAKVSLLLGRKIWGSISPALGRLAVRWNDNLRDKTELAKSDHIFLISEITRRFVIIIMFKTLYFISIYHDPDVDKNKLPYFWVMFAEAATRIFSFVASYNAGSLFVWAGVISQARLSIYQQSKQSDQ